MDLTTFIRRMPKVELHVHLEGSVRPETLLRLAQKHGISLPARSLDDLRAWYAFTDFDHFVDIYMQISDCIRTPADIELIAREFLEGQAAQNILHSEVTYTAYTHHRQKGIPFAEQLAALNRARRWGAEALGISMNFVIDILRSASSAIGIQTAEWALSGQKDGVVALGLGGPEVGNPPEKHASAFALAAAEGLPAVPHAGETDGPASIWGAVEALHAVRIGHGVRCLEDPELVALLRARQIPLEVSPTSNVCLGVADSFASHPLPQLMAAGLFVTLNSDDPPLFNTTLTDEFLQAAFAYAWDVDAVKGLVRNALAASLLPAEQKAALRARCEAGFKELEAEAANAP